MNFDLLEEQALDLPLQERAQLAYRLLKGLDELSESEAEQVWLSGAARCACEIDVGKVQLISADELEHRTQASLQRPA